MQDNQSEKDPMAEAVSESLILMADVMANPKKLSATIIEAWVSVMRSQDVTPDQVRQAALRLIGTEKFFPTPSDFVKLLRPVEDRDAAEEIAWQRTLGAVRQIGGRGSLTAEDFGGDGLTLWVVSRMGWERICRELMEDNRAIWQAEFRRLYRAGKTVNATASYLPGWFERQNLAEGHDLTPSLCGRPDWKALPERTELPAGEVVYLPLRGMDDGEAA